MAGCPLRPVCCTRRGRPEPAPQVPAPCRMHDALAPEQHRTIWSFQAGRGGLLRASTADACSTQGAQNSSKAVRAALWTSADAVQHAMPVQRNTSLSSQLPTSFLKLAAAADRNTHGQTVCRSKCRLGGLPQRGEAEQVIRMACLGGHIAPSLATMEALARVNLQLEQLHGPAC